MQPFIRVHQLRQSFGTQEVLKGVSFDVDISTTDYYEYYNY